MELIWPAIVALGKAAVLLTALVALLVRPRRAGWVRAVACFGVALALADAWASYQLPYDFKRFWRVGRTLAQGADYYALRDPRDDGDRQMILNPPTVLPLFRALALAPLPQSAAAWTALNALGVLALVPLAHRALRAQMGPGAPELPRPTLEILSAALALSCGHGMGLALGQVSALSTAAILAALHAQARGRGGRAGLWLAIATAKANTALPFLLLFRRKPDRRTWAGLALSCAGLCALTGGLAEVPARCATTIRTIRTTFEPGRVNDYGFSGPSHVTLIGLDHALHRVGLRDRRWIGSAQAAALAILGAGLARLTRPGARPRGLSCALVALYATMFLYHRVYDLVILALPLAYAALPDESAPGPSRRRAVGGALILLALYVNPDGLRLIEQRSFRLGLSGPALQAIALPMATWLVLLATAALLSAPAGRRATDPPEATPLPPAAALAA